MFLFVQFFFVHGQVDAVNLWLGANVMMEFSFDEADQLLSGNLETGVCVEREETDTERERETEEGGRSE